MKPAIAPGAQARWIGINYAVGLILLAMVAGVTWPAVPTALADDEVERTWIQALVYLPGDDEESGHRMADLSPADLLPDDGPVRVLVYAHGCAGIGKPSRHIGQALARRGWLVVQPDSFARRNKPKSCDAVWRIGGLHRAVLGWRQAEISHALNRLSDLGVADSADIFLMGFSEGAIAVATFRGQPVRGRIIEGWTCHAGWPEYRGLNAPLDEPVLALVGARDPWFRAPVLHGDCGAYMTGRQGGRSIVYHAPSPRHDDHWLSHDDSVLQDILAFLIRK